MPFIFATTRETNHVPTMMHQSNSKPLFPHRVNVRTFIIFLHHPKRYPRYKTHTLSLHVQLTVTVEAIYKTERWQMFFEDAPSNAVESPLCTWRSWCTFIWNINHYCTWLLGEEVELGKILHVWMALQYAITVMRL